MSQWWNLERGCVVKRTTPSRFGLIAEGGNHVWGRIEGETKGTLLLFWGSPKHPSWIAWTLRNGSPALHLPWAFRVSAFQVLQVDPGHASQSTHQGPSRRALRSLRTLGVLCFPLFPGKAKKTGKKDTPPPTPPQRFGRFFQVLDPNLTQPRSCRRWMLCFACRAFERYVSKGVMLNHASLSTPSQR